MITYLYNFSKGYEFLNSLKNSSWSIAMNVADFRKWVNKIEMQRGLLVFENDLVCHFKLMIEKRQNW